MECVVCDAPRWANPVGGYTHKDKGEIMTDGNVTIQPETIVVGSGAKEWDRQRCPHCLDRGKCRSEMSGLAQWHHVCDRCDIEWDSELPIDTGHDGVDGDLVIQDMIDAARDGISHV